MKQQLSNTWSTILALALALTAGTSITFYAISNRCPLSMEGGSSGFKLQVEQCDP